MEKASGEAIVEARRTRTFSTPAGLALSNFLPPKSDEPPDEPPDAGSAFAFAFSAFSRSLALCAAKLARALAFSASASSSAVSSVAGEGDLLRFEKKPGQQQPTENTQRE